MKIALLTSSRADYSLYLPLLRSFQEDPFFQIDIIAFGTHPSYFFDRTVQKIIQDGFEVKFIIENLILGESPEAITDGMGLTMIKFSHLWSSNNYDLCVTLGDRYEMFAAAYSTLAFNLPIAHIAGGEITLGAIDNTFRDALTVLAKYHFASSEIYTHRIMEIKGNSKNIYNVGSLSIDNIIALKFLSIEAFMKEFKIDLSKPSILFTFHPETVSLEKNRFYIHEIILALEELMNFQIIITMPNADTMGTLIREALIKFSSNHKNVYIKESLGNLGYLSCMKHCSFMMGNSSSGFVEASYFPKWVLNLGDRQKGRIQTSNIFNCKINKIEILNAIINKDKLFKPEKTKLYGEGNAAKQISSILKKSSSESNQ